MNNLPNMKIANLRDTLSEIDKQICDNHNSQQDCDIRNLIDQRRHILAQMQIEIDSDPLYSKHPNRDAYNINSQTQNLINTWCSRVKHATPNIVSFEDEEFCNLFIDQVLPQKWHFDNDAVVIISPPSDHIIKALKNRGQKHIVTYHDGSVPTNIANNTANLQSTHTCKSLEELERLFALLQAPAQQVITISCETDASKSQELRQNISEAVNSGKKTRFENTRTVSKFGQPWAVNVLRNLPALQNARNFHELRVSGVKDAVVVASGPSLNKNVDELRNIQDSTFIVSALRSLPVLNAAGVEPDVVIQLDAEDD